MILLILLVEPGRQFAVGGHPGGLWYERNRELRPGVGTMQVTGGIIVNNIKATWKNGQVQLDVRADWPEGRRLVVAEDCLADVDFMTEEQQSDDPAEIERWIAELQALPGVTMTAEEEADLLEWRRKAKEFNVDAMRRQMAGGTP